MAYNPSREVGNLKPKEYKRNYHKPKVTDGREIESLIDLGVECLKMGRAPYFANTEDGLEEFKKITFDFFESVNEHNRIADNEDIIIPDIEIWCGFLGITRQTLNAYEKDRDGDWSNFIRQTKDIIFACKKQLGLKNRLNGLVFVMDSCNNHDYYNTNEFKVTQTVVEPQRRIVNMNDLPNLEELNREIEEREKLPIIDLPPLENLGEENDMPFPQYEETQPFKNDYNNETPFD